MNLLPLSCPSHDLDDILSRTEPLWQSLRGERLFVTGGTGFVGCWLLESLVWANGRLNLGLSVEVLSRDPARFTRQYPWLAGHACLQYRQGDVRSFEFPEGHFSHVIHAATEAPTVENDDRPLLKFETMVHGTQRTLDFARQCGAGKVLLTSSGAVYAKQPPALLGMVEDYPEASDPTNPAFVNGEGKRASEMLCALYARQFGLDVKIARLFSFIGPYLQLDFHYAAGNFVRDALSGGPIRLTGDGSPIRSFQYGADLAVWLWTILSRGETCRPYNVGSEEAVTIAELAELVGAAVRPRLPVERPAESGVPGLRSRYVPSTVRAHRELGLEDRTDLATAITRTVDWCQARGGNPAGE